MQTLAKRQSMQSLKSCDFLATLSLVRRSKTASPPAGPLPARIMNAIDRLPGNEGVARQKWHLELQSAVALLVFLALANAAAFAVFWFDKRQSERGGRRIRERTLLWLAVGGGSVGALAAQQILRHKTRKQPFRRRLFAIGALHLIILLLSAFPALRQTLGETITGLF